METDGSNVHRLTPDMKVLLGVRMSSYEEYSPSWTNDGSHVVFLSNAHGNYEVLSVSADGKDVQRLTNTDQPERNVSAAVDVPQIAFERVMASDEADIVAGSAPDGSQRSDACTADHWWIRKVPACASQVSAGRQRKGGATWESDGPIAVANPSTPWMRAASTRRIFFRRRKTTLSSSPFRPTASVSRITE